ncbi:MAG: hypothetical protein ABI382_01320 [Nakamurella sp.]
MSLVGVPLLLLVLMLALGLPLLAVLCWCRVRGPSRLRWTQRIGLLLCSQLAAVLAFGVALNDEFDFFSSWTALVASGSHAVPVITTVPSSANDSMRNPPSAGRITNGQGGN